MLKKMVLAACLLLCHAGSLFSADSAEVARYIVRIKSPTILTQSYVQRGQAIKEPRVLVEVREALKQLMVTQMGVTPVRELRLVPAIVADLTETQAKLLAENKNVLYVEPSVEVTLAGYDYPPTPDPEDAQVTSWGVRAIRAEQVWPQTRGSGVKVAVIDSGIDADHPEFAGIYAGGTDIINRDSNPEDSLGHGTHVAGIIAAADNDSGVVGVAPSVSLYAVKTFNGASISDVSILADAIEWCITHDIDVINMSLGMRNGVTVIEEACQAAYDQGVVIVAATGNDGSPYFVSYPGAYPTTLAVGSVNADHVISSFSNRGPQVDLVAPGDPILSTYPRGGGAWQELQVNGVAYESFNIGSVPFATRSGEAVLVPGVGTPEDFATVDVSGKIAVVSRGEIPFRDKGANAHAAGAVGLVVFQQADKADELPSGWSYSGEGNVPPITENVPALGVRHDAGAALAGQQVTIICRASDFQSAIGTSMATPHGAGAAALLLSLDGSLTTEEVFDTLKNSAVDLGSAGRDNTYGHGLLDVRAAADRITPDCDLVVAAFSVSSQDRLVSLDAGASMGCGLRYAWDFGDGTGATGAVVTHDYAANGTYTITLTVTDAEGVSDSADRQVNVSQCELPVTASFSTNTNLLNLVVDGSASSGCDITLAWNFGDGAQATGTNAAHTYAVAGSYTVTLTVTDKYGVSVVDSQVVTVVDCDSETSAVFSASVNNKTVSLNASASSGCDLSYAWDLGDGNTADGIAPTHIYATSGDYTVTLAVTDRAGLTDSTSRLVTVEGCAAPQAVFSAQASLLTVALDASDSSGCGLSYSWDLGDGGRADGAQLDYTYAEGGSYTVTLTVTDEEGRRATDSRQILVSGIEQCTVLSNKQPVVVSGLTGDALCFEIDVHPDAFLPKFQTYGGFGNVDLYIAKGRPATADDYDYRNIGSGTDEAIRVYDRDVAGIWYITVLGIADFQDVSVEVRYAVF